MSFWDACKGGEKTDVTGRLLQQIALSALKCPDRNVRLDKKPDIPVMWTQHSQRRTAVLGWTVVQPGGGEGRPLQEALRTGGWGSLDSPQVVQEPSSGRARGRQAP